jgi:hypothetical protein
VDACSPRDRDLLLGAAAALSWKPPKTLTIVISLPPKSATTFGTQILHPACHRNLHWHTAPQVLTHHHSITVSSKNPPSRLSPHGCSPLVDTGTKRPPPKPLWHFCGSYICVYGSVFDVLTVPLFCILFYVLLFLLFSLFHVLSFYGFCWKASQVFGLLEFILFTMLMVTTANLIMLSAL